MAREADCERFAALARLPEVSHLFIGRVPGIDTLGDREVVVPRFAKVHEEIRSAEGLGGPMVAAEQVHGAKVVRVGTEDAGRRVAGCDGLVTNVAGVVLAIYVADCCAVFLVDRVVGAIGLVHSGRKGSEGNITGAAIELMGREYGCRAENMVVQLSPCIRPPLYEVDFAAEIRAQARAAGVVAVHDEGVCTGARVDRYYSYRVEKGRTGRLLALLRLNRRDGTAI